MIVGLKILDDFKVEDTEDLVRELHKRKLIDFTFEEVKKLVEKEWDCEFDNVQLNDDCINYVLEDLANGKYNWEWHEGNEKFTIYVIDTDNPYMVSGHVPKSREKVAFT